MTIPVKLQTLVWFAKRPKLYPQLLFVVSRKLFRRGRTREDSRVVMESWCAERALDTQTALTQLTGMTTLTPVDRLFDNHFENADKIAKACPEKMGGPGEIDKRCLKRLKALIRLTCVTMIATKAMMAECGLTQFCGTRSSEAVSLSQMTSATMSPFVTLQTRLKPTQL